MRSIALVFLFILGSSFLGAETCPEGFQDTGTHCIKPPAYGRGFGYMTIGQCERNYGSSACEKCLLLYYPKCKENYEPAGCNLCSPKCPANMTDIGVSCQK